MKLFEFLKSLRRHRFPPTEKELKPFQKAAVLFQALPAAVSSSLLNRLNRKEILKVGREMPRVKNVPISLKEQIVHQFWGMLVEHAKLSPTSQPTLDAIEHAARQNPDDFLAIIRQYWLSDNVQEPLRVEEKPRDEASKFYHFPNKLIQKLFSMISDEDMGVVAEEIFQSFAAPRGKHASRTDESSEMGNVIKDFLQLLPESYSITQRSNFQPPEKIAILLLLLKPKRSLSIGKKLLNRLSREQLEALILAFLQIQEVSEKGKTDVLTEFLSYCNASFVASTFRDESRLLEEIERMALHMPHQIARCLHSRWLIEKHPLAEWEELSEKNPELACQKLADYFNQNVQAAPRHLTNWQKAAIFLQTVTPEVKEKVLHEMHPEETAFLVPQMKRAWSISAEEKRKVLEEFLGDYYFLSTTKLLENQEL